MEKAELGAWGEEVACGYLRKHGYQIIHRNWSCRLGEIDIVARDGDALVFVEVKARSSSRYGGPESAVTPRKQGKIIATAKWYLSGQPIELPVRFDVLTISGKEVTLYQNAFQT